MSKKFFKLFFLIISFTFLTGCLGDFNPNGSNSKTDYPYFVTSEATVVKKIMVPPGTKLVYEEQFFKKGKQDNLLNESKLRSIEFPTNKSTFWGGVPITSIVKYYNTDMRGFSVYADFTILGEDDKTKFSQMWESCGDHLGITINNLDDWSFNKRNIADVESCSVLYQRYFKDDVEQQNFLDEMYAALMEVVSK